jgi:glycosyltransferase involved in cell wall biosynthesis
MKILFDHPNPFLLAHGGFQTQIEQTKAALEGLGLTVEWLRWWDDTQAGDLIHYFGRPTGAYIGFAHQKHLPVVMSELLGGLAARPASQRLLQRCLMRGAQRLLPAAFTAKLAWDAYPMADACIALTPWEAELMRRMFDAPAERVHVVPNGVEPEFLTGEPVARGEWLVCTATITERKRVLELAEAAVAAEVPVWIVGRPYAEEDPYARRFLEVARQHPRWIRYEGAITNRARMAEVYRGARGFVLLSSMESLSLSALEAAACGCPLLLSDLPWARTTFGVQASYCPVTRDAKTTARHLRSFHAAAPQLPIPTRPKSWPQVAQQLADLYRSLLRTSR